MVGERPGIKDTRGGTGQRSDRETTTGKRLLRAAQTARPISRIPATMARPPGLEMRMSPAPMPLNSCTIPLMVCSRAAVMTAGAMATEGQRSRVAKVMRAEGSAKPISGTTSKLTGRPSAVMRWK